jgi:energy-coupling factor transporter ATP-binding protein EcfA2
MQKVTNETITFDRIRSSLGYLTVEDSMIENVGPALNSGRAILLYGPPGNGKTSVAMSIASAFTDVIYIPYAVTVEGQIMRVFDPSVHTELSTAPSNDDAMSSFIRTGEYDARWVPCKRPFIITGGELTLEMLDLRYDEHANFYEAPLHVKAFGGCFIIDDFGRQLVSPKNLLNRWIVPLGEPLRLPETAYRQELHDPLRRADHLLHEPGTGRPDGSRLPAPASIQDRGRRTQVGNVQDHFPRMNANGKIPAV